MDSWGIALLVFISALIAIGLPWLMTFHDRSMDKAMKVFEDDHLITLATYDKDTEMMVVTYKSGRVAKFKGTGTVWFTYPLMERCWTPMEMKLTNIKRYIKEHGNPYPIAHEVA